MAENLPSAPSSPPAPEAAPSSYEGSLSQRPTFAHSTSFVDSQSNQQYQMVAFLPSKKASKVLLLHGNLDIWIHEAKNLPKMDMFHKKMEEVLNSSPENKSKITRDPYVSVAVTTAVIARTYVIWNSEDPVWKQHFNVPVAHNAAEVNFLVKDSDVVGSQLIGTVTIPVEQLYLGTRIEGLFPILGTNGKPCKAGAVMKLTIQYFSIEKLSLYYNGIGAGPQYVGVPGTYFPLRRGGRVTLYQDAHVQDGSLPDIRLDQDRHYVRGSCWSDIFDAISKARRLIYITGWSVWHKVKLVRGVAQNEISLGDLLKMKSQEGVRVLLLVWDDPTSRSILGYRTDGMGTHDEETRKFFKHSSVQVILTTRIAGKRDSWIKQQEAQIYTHHQKTVIVDTDAGYGKRRILAFVGGLDLSDGRYDSPEHPLFRTSQTVHEDDYHNPTFTGNLAGCLKEPWHDMHSKIDGPAAYDVLTNFEERWLKASKPRGLRKLRTSYDDSLLRIDRVPDLLGINDQSYHDDQDPEGWHVQIFRSIDSNSVKGFPKDPTEATSKNLVCGKNVLIDMSIHTAYVKAIRSAQHFIYIENQYLIGSSFNWSSHKVLGANNLIPMEIALKIASKIRARERFAVYIIIPVWPQGVPTATGFDTQRILYWQNTTIQMMYETIHKALVEVGLHGVFSPQDYLNFFCLGNREALGPHDNVRGESPGSGNIPQGLARKSRQFMIYVHSKGMIVDDEYVIIGSANINQRSMEGTQDTEIAMGAYQPHHTWATKLSNPRGQIYGYRMSLWAEHLGLVDDRFTQPESLECVRYVRSLSEANWRQFRAYEVSEMKGHLLKYPFEVDPKGKEKIRVSLSTHKGLLHFLEGIYFIQGIQRFGLKKVLSATNNFSHENLITEGPLGRVYKGQLLWDGNLMNVTVRRLNCMYPYEDESHTEISTLKSLKHKNIISLFGCCDENYETIIIYGQAFHGTLDKHLSDPNLTWSQRLQICLGVARALQYIHCDIIHCDINSSKVFLDHDWEPKIYGFEISTKYPQSWRHRLLYSRYFGTNNVTLKYDVYCFGVLLLEVLWGRKPVITDDCIEEEQIDSNLWKQMDKESSQRFKSLADKCLNQQLIKRPTMDQIVKELEEAFELHRIHANLENPKAIDEGATSNNFMMDLLKIPLYQIKRATENFNEKYVVGGGAYGIVYKAELAVIDINSRSSMEGNCKDEMLKISKTVAIKRIYNRPDEQGKQGFLTEIKLLTSCKHPNIVSLLGYSSEASEMILVYEYAFNGSLSDYFGSSVTTKTINLTWAQRIQICLDIAHGINYIHTHMEGKPRIIHRDIKSDNILLDENRNAKLADFGLSQFQSMKQLASTVYTNNLAGTEVYMDPEYLTTFKYNRKSDVYSFGVVLFEVLSGSLAYDAIYVGENKMGLAAIARRRYNDGTLKELIDSKITEEDDDHIFTFNRGPSLDSFDAFSNIAYCCLAETQAKRPTIDVVITELENALNLQGETMVLSRFRLDDIKSATKNFAKSYCIGSDTNAMLYKAELNHFGNSNLLATEGKNRGVPSKKPITIKRITGREGIQVKQDFFAELEMGNEYKPHNAASLLGFCDEVDEMILVYDYAPEM